MKKSFYTLLALTILSGCSTLEFWKSDDNKVSGSRHAPPLNNQAMTDSPQMLAGGSSPSSMPLPPAPPSGGLGSDDFMSNPNIAQSLKPSVAVQSQGQPMAAPQASNGTRRMPLLNQQITASGGDMASASPTPQVSQNQLPQGDLQVPPPPPVMAQPMGDGKPAKPNNTYPQLASVPPEPPTPTPANEDARVAQMRQDLADMQQQQTATFKASGNSMAISNGGSGSSVQVQTPRQPGNGNNQPNLVAQSPADPYLAQAQTAQIPPPPQFKQQAQLAQPMVAPQPQQQMQQSPPQTYAQPALMPSGPTIVVHSKSPNARPYNPQENQQMAMATPPQQPAYTPMPPPQVQSAQLPPPVMAQPQAQSQPQVVNHSGSFTRAPSMGNPPSNMGGGMAQPQQASTSAGMLHPIAVDSAPTYASSNDAPQSQSGWLADSNLPPVPTNNIHLLPDSRYAAMRTDSRDGSGY